MEVRRPRHSIDRINGTTDTRTHMPIDLIESAGPLGVIAHCIPMLIGALLNDWRAKEQEIVRIEEETARLIGEAQLSGEAEPITSNYSAHSAASATSDGSDGSEHDQLTIETWTLAALVGATLQWIASLRRAIVDWTTEQIQRTKSSFPRHTRGSWRLWEWHLLLVLGGFGVLAIGYLLSCIPQGPICYSSANMSQRADCTEINSFSDIWVPPPFFKPTRTVVSIPTMSQRSGSISYMFGSAGICILLYVACFIVSDVLALVIPYLVLLSQHALLVFMVRDQLIENAATMWPSNTPWWAQILGQLQILIGFQLILRWLSNRNLYLRLS